MAIALGLAITLAMTARVHAGTAFTYQGQLKQGGNNVNASADMQFLLFDGDGGGATQIGSTLTITNLLIEDGLFTIDLDFGSGAFNGDSRWLQIAVRSPHDPGNTQPYTTLSPRQPVMPAPYAQFALSAYGPNITNLDAGNITSGEIPASVMTGTYNLSGAFAGSFSGSGAGLNLLNASNLASGTLPSARLAGIYNAQLTFNNPSNVFAGFGAGLTDLNASNLASGTVPGARLGGTYSNPISFNNVNNFFAGNGASLFNLNANTLASGTVPGARLAGTYANALTFSNASNVLVGDGAGLTGLNAANIASGTLDDARLSSNVPLKDSINTFSANNVFNGNVGIGTSFPSARLQAVQPTANAIGILAQATNSVALNYAIIASTTSPNGYAGYFTGPAGSRNYFERRVGIGTPNSIDLLHINNFDGNAHARISCDNGGISSLRLFELTGADYFGFELEYDGSDDKLRLWSRQFSGNEGVRMTWLKDGKVGIGTESPVATLHVEEGDSGMGVILPGLRVEQNATSPNVIGGYSGNFVSSGIVGATISGGGREQGDNVNAVTDFYGTVGGGIQNTASGFASTIGGGETNEASGNRSFVGGGNINEASGHYSTVGGGWGNIAGALDATVGGGDHNTASNQRSTVGGGRQNTASGSFSTIGGGEINEAIGPYATVPGGQSNRASGSHAFAAGRRAKADHLGAFVWGDSTNADFVSTGADQFLIRASGGVGIGTNNPAALLHLQDNGSDVAMKLRAGGSWTAEIQQTNTSYFNFTNGGQVRMTIRSGGQVGIGTQEPGGFLLAVNGSAAKPGGGSWSAFSDARLKCGIEPLAPGVLDRLLSLRGYTFEYLDHAIDNRLALPGSQTGLIAQEVAEVFPEWVDADDEGYLYITERGTTALFIEAMRELREEKDAEIYGLRNENRDLRDRVAALERLLEQIVTAPEFGQ